MVITYNYGYPAPTNHYRAFWGIPPTSFGGSANTWVCLLFSPLFPLFECSLCIPQFPVSDIVFGYLSNGLPGMSATAWYLGDPLPGRVKILVATWDESFGYGRGCIKLSMFSLSPSTSFLTFSDRCFYSSFRRR